MTPHDEAREREIRARLDRTLNPEDGVELCGWLKSSVSDLRWLLDRLTEARTERDAFVHLFDPDDHNVVGAMMEAQAAHKAMTQHLLEANQAKNELTEARADLVEQVKSHLETGQLLAESCRRRNTLEAALAGRDATIRLWKGWRDDVTVKLRNPGGARFDEVPRLVSDLVQRAEAAVNEKDRLLVLLRSHGIEDL